jgi:glutamine amidotransferase
LPDRKKPRIAIVDYGMGNLFSVKHACEQVGLEPQITSSPQEVLAAEAVILPGIGAFGDAMKILKQLNMVDTLQNVAASSKPLVGICLGMQLLMTESFEFGRHAGLGVIPGTVVRFEKALSPNGVMKIPQVCWNQLHRAGADDSDPWQGSMLDGLPDGVFMYFVHSFYVKPEMPGVTLATSSYGDTAFCSALSLRNIFACQCHPERSGRDGLQVYANLAKSLKG